MNPPAELPSNPAIVDGRSPRVRSFWAPCLVFVLFAFIAGVSGVAFIYQYQSTNVYGDKWRDEVGAWPHLCGHLLRTAIFSMLAWCLWRYLRAIKRLRGGGQSEWEGFVTSLARWWTSLAVGVVIILLYAGWTAFGDVQRSPVQPLSPRYRADKSANSPIKAEFRIAETAPLEGLIETTIPGIPDRVFLHTEASLTNRDIASSRIVVASNGQPAVDFTVEETSQQKMYDVTSANKGKYLVVLVDGQVVAGATISWPIRSSGRIHGDFTQAEVQRMAKALTGKD